mmetsp:Transcript_13671/g.29647  ORF Transcript_13671/g.29647 Transcript_13671/m.29647 type:complete len:321 (-) Transcript_13671:325-1287(-)
MTSKQQLKCTSNTFIELLPPHIPRTPVRARRPIKPHKKMAEVVLKVFVVHMVIRRRAQPESSKEGFPRKCYLRVDQSQPVGVRRSKRHVRPHVTHPHDVRRGEEGEKYHYRRVRHAPVERVEQFRIGEFVVRLVRHAVNCRVSDVLQAMHHELHEVLAYQALRNAGVLYPSLEGVVGRGEQVEHPRDSQVRTQEQESPGLGEVILQRRRVDVLCRPTTLHRRGLSEQLLLMQPEIDEQEEVPDGHRGDAQRESQRMAQRCDAAVHGRAPFPNSPLLDGFVEPISAVDRVPRPWEQGGVMIPRRLIEKEREEEHERPDREA